MNVITVEHLFKAYGPVVAVDDISFQVEEGEIFGIVGPNGAGKTTTVECIEGLRFPDRGTVTVLGLDPRTEGDRLRQEIGVQLQEAALPDRIKVWEALDLYASFYPRTVAWAELLEQFSLAEKKEAYFARLSGGQKQRLFIALALLNDPRIVFLDELTTGLDPQARRAMWDLVRQVRDRGKTVVLITHFMEEAERLCDRVAVIDRGRIIALDTPRNLIRRLGGEVRAIFTVAEVAFTTPASMVMSTAPAIAAPSPAVVDRVRQALAGVPQVTKVESAEGEVVVHGQGTDFIVAVVTRLGAAGIYPQNLRTEQATLDDVFLALTGRKMRD
ncbi:MAG TPA: ABC transporter ATP-binding protein [Firmicutes bacterium]|nr:ABC transporter ATP-binding protein [Bacillota bacterium]